MNKFTLLVVALFLGLSFVLVSCKDDTNAATIHQQQEEKKDTIAWDLAQEFPSKDSIIIRADLYMKHNRNAPFIILFHQAGWSRGEYLEIAPKLNDLGYNCMAVDLRSGDEINGTRNITKANAAKANKDTEYPDAVQDMLASIEYAKEHFSEGEFILWGSSYSSALVLRIFGEDQNLADKSLSFAPGEYFGRFGLGNEYVTSAAKKIFKPVFITSRKDERNSWWNIYEQIPSEDKAYFLPETTGNHGSRALWDRFSDSDAYWKAVKDFLAK